MNSKLSSNKKIKSCFTADAWSALSEYEQRRYENVQKNYEILKANGITPKLPDFIMNKFKRPIPSKNKASIGKQKGNQEQKAKFKLFAVPKQPVSAFKDSKKGVSSDISVIITTESPSSETVTTTMISLRGAKRKEFAQNVLKLAQNTLKALEGMYEDKETDFKFDVEDVNFLEPGCSKDIEPKRRYPKRNVAKKCYKEEDLPSEDEFLYCEICTKEYKGPCPVHGPMLLVCDTKVPKGESDRAKRTIPHFFSIGISSIPKAGLGVWTEMPLVEGMVFGPYEGSVVKKKEYKEKSGYAWEVRKESKPHHYVEAEDKDCSNWMRYVNCAAHEEWQSVIAFQYLGKIFYKTFKPVLPFTELLVWYGNSYASDMGIEIKARKCLQPPKEITGFSCDVCSSLFSSAESLSSHRKTHPRTQNDKRHRCPEAYIHSLHAQKT